MNAKTIVSPFSAEELKEIIGKFTSNTNTNSDFQPTSAATSGFSTATHPTPWSSEAASEFPQTNVSTIPPQYTPQYAACGPVGATVMPQLPNRFPIQAVPELIREAMIDALHFSQAPDALVAGCALSAVSLACQNFVDVERLPGLVGPVSLSIAIIATTGERKTFVDSLFTKPFRDFDEEQSKRTEALRPRYEAALTAWKQQCRAITSAISTAAKKGQSVEGLTYRLEELNANKPKEPYSRQYIVDDSTPAELKFKLRHPFSSVGIFSDEAKVLVKSGLLNNFAMLNKLWDAGTISVGRRSSESFRISNVRVTTSLGIHPYLFFKHFCDDGSEARPVGNLARNLIAFPPSTIGDRPITEQRSSYPHLLNFQTRIAELIRLEHSAIEAGKHTRRSLGKCIEIASHRYAWSRSHIRLDIAPECSFQLDQPCNQRFIPVNAMNLQVLTTEQNSNIRRSFTGHDELMLNLQLNVLRHTLLPEPAAVNAGGFAFEDLDVRSTDDLPVDIGQHPVQLGIGMLKDRIDAPHSIAGTSCVVRCHDGFEDVSPIGRTFLVERISLG